MIRNPPSATCRLPGRPREFDLDRVLDAAVRVFRERGYHATSIADLRRAMGLTAGSLYKAFGDKRGVYVAALERYLRDRESALTTYLAGADTGKDRVRALLQGYAAVSHDAEGRLGCLVLGGVTDIDTFDAGLAEHFRAALSRLENRFAAALEQGIADGSVASDLDVTASARYLLCVVEGMRALGKRGATMPEVDAVVEQAMRALR